MANTVMTNDSTAGTSFSFLFPTSLAPEMNGVGGSAYTTNNSQPIAKLEYFPSFFNTPEYNIEACSSTSSTENHFHYFEPTSVEQANGGLDVSQLPSTSNLQQSVVNNMLVCEQKPRILASAKRKGNLRNAADSPSMNASQPGAEALDPDEQRRRLSCQLIEPLRLRISSSNTCRRGGSADAPVVGGSSHRTIGANISPASQANSTPSTAAIYTPSQQQPFSFLPSLLPSHNYEQKQEFMAQLFGAFNQQPTTSTTVNNFWQDLPNMWNSTNNTQLEDQSICPKVQKRAEGSVWEQDETLEHAIKHLSEEQDLMVVHEKVASTPKPKKLIPSENYTGEIITLDDEDEEERLARFLRFYSNSADFFNETFSDQDGEVDEEDDEEEQQENDTEEIEEEKYEVKQEDLKQNLKETTALKSIFAKYKKKAEKKENKLIDRLKFERRKNLELSEECSTINRKLKESEMVRVHMQDGLDTLEELRTENFQLRQTSESRLASLNSTMQVKRELQNVVESLREQNKRLEDEKERQSREHSCVICLDAKREILFMPCLHFNTCETCSKTAVMTHCSICRQMIMGKLKVYQ